MIQNEPINGTSLFFASMVLPLFCVTFADGRIQDHGCFLGCFVFVEIDSTGSVNEVFPVPVIGAVIGALGSGGSMFWALTVLLDSSCG